MTRPRPHSAALDYAEEAARILDGDSELRRADLLLMQATAVWVASGALWLAALTLWGVSWWWEPPN